jgi:hypothetical protein
MEFVAKKANVTTDIETQNILSVVTPCFEAASGKKSGALLKNDQTPATVPSNQNTSIPYALVLLLESKAEFESSLSERFLLIFMLFAITAIARIKKTMDKRPIR